MSFDSLGQFFPACSNSFFQSLPACGYHLFVCFYIFGHDRAQLLLRVFDILFGLGLQESKLYLHFFQVSTQLRNRFQSLCQAESLSGGLDGIHDKASAHDPKQAPFQ